MSEREEQQTDPEPGPVKHTDAERVTGSEAEPEAEGAEREEEEDAATS
jgi:hypothetical protein